MTDMTTTADDVVAVQTLSHFNELRINNICMPKLIQFGTDNKEAETFVASAGKPEATRPQMSFVQSKEKYQEKVSEKELDVVIHAPDHVRARDYADGFDWRATKILAHCGFGAHVGVLDACNTKKTRSRVEYYFGRVRPPDCSRSIHFLPRDVLSLQACGWGPPTADYVKLAHQFCLGNKNCQDVKGKFLRVLKLSLGKSLDLFCLIFSRESRDRIFLPCLSSFLDGRLI